jgi:hypothetical protein
VNSLSVTVRIEALRDLKAGEPVRDADIGEIASVDLGVVIGSDQAFILLRTQGWWRSLFFDLEPLMQANPGRQFDVTAFLLAQQIALMGRPLAGFAQESQLDRMTSGLRELRELISDHCTEEKKYQELLSNHHWMFGGAYNSIQRHKCLDDETIPDFTAERSDDHCHDVVEIKQPFLKCFKEDGKLTAAFNSSWDQTVRYLTFAQRQRSFLREEKSLKIENPKGLLLIGYGFDEGQMQTMREKEAVAPAIRTITWDQLIRRAEATLQLFKDAAS